MSVSSTPTQKELLGFVAKLVVDTFERTQKPVDGSFLSYAIRQEYPMFQYSDIGLAKLADAVRLVEQQGLIVRNRKVQHLEVFPAGLQSEPETGADVRHIRLRKEVWEAFVHAERSEIDYLNARTGVLVSLGTSSPDYDSSQDWSKLERIPEETQRQWLEEFFERHSEISKDDAPVGDMYWWHSVPTWLADKNPKLASEWNRHRSRRACEWAKTWAEARGVSMSLLLEKSAVVPNPPALQLETPSHSDLNDESRIRKAILAALSELPFDELQMIPIPPRLLLRHLSSR